jgi:AcrR family transcriptional regulator
MKKNRAGARTMPADHKKNDRRTARTRRALSDALVELILEKRFDSITVQNVIDRADVGRSTFYAHFDDKEDLFLRGWEGLLDSMARNISWQNLQQGRFLPVAELFSHVREFHEFYLALVRSRKTALLFRSGQIYLSRSIERALAERLAGDANPPAIPVSVIAGHLAADLLMLLKWWLDHDMPCTALRMDEIFHQLAMPGFRAAMEASG